MASQIVFGPGANGALSAALARARQLGTPYVGTEHMLLGLIDVTSVIPRDQRARLEQAILRRIEPGTPLGHVGELPYTPGAVSALQSAMRRARQSDPCVVTPEHLLLALHEDAGRIVQAALRECGLHGQSERESGSD